MVRIGTFAFVAAVGIALLGGPGCKLSSDEDGVRPSDAVATDGGGATDVAAEDASAADTAADTSTGEDAGATGDAAGDAGDAIADGDAVASDTEADTMPDGGADTADDAASDAVAGDDTAMDDTATCETLAAEAEAALAEASAGCDAVDSCRLFGWPICGTFGCFQGAIRTDADLTALEEAVAPASDAGCAGFTCGCDAPDGAAACLDGACRMCPPDCGTSCADIEAAVDYYAAQAAEGCADDGDCAVVQTTVCEIGSYVACHGFGYRTDRSPDEVLALIEGFILPELNCTWAACDCQAATPRCVDGACRAE